MSGDPFAFERTIFECAPALLPQAVECANWLRKNPEHKSCAFVKDVAGLKVSFFAYRNKASISVKQGH